MASAVDTLRVVARSLPVLAVNRLSKVQPERTGCGGITDNVPPGSTAYHFVNCSYHIFLCYFFANCIAWRQVNLHKFPLNMLPYNGFSNVVLARY